MATENVAYKVRDTGRIDDLDRLNELIYKTRGIVGVIRAACDSTEPPPDDAIPGACWAVEDMLSEIKTITDRRI
jgi:hypothetical protein